MVVAQLVERSLPIPDVHGSNPVFGKIYIEHSSVLKRKKCPRIAQFVKKRPKWLIL